MHLPTKKTAGQGKTCAALALLVLVVIAPVAAQKKKKSKDAPKPQPAADTTLPQTDSQAVDRTISEALGYWQLGDVESLHKYYSDDVVVVSGAWEQPVIGWSNYTQSYLAQRARVSGVRMDRTNTYIKVSGGSAWATYQWLYGATVDGRFTQFRGHTTLVLAKLADRWVIVLDHSSIVPDYAQATAASAANPEQPGKP